MNCLPYQIINSSSIQRWPCPTAVFVQCRTGWWAYATPTCAWGKMRKITKNTITYGKANEWIPTNSLHEESSYSEIRNHSSPDIFLIPASICKDVPLILPVMHTSVFHSLSVHWSRLLFLSMLATLIIYFDFLFMQFMNVFTMQSIMWNKTCNQSTNPQTNQ